MFGMDSNKTPSEIIAELCVEAGISKSELARRLEITPSQITRILNGDTKTISSDILIKLTKLFGVSADYLLGITDKKEIIKEKYISYSQRQRSDPYRPRRPAFEKQPFACPFFLLLLARTGFSLRTTCCGSAIHFLTASPLNIRFSVFYSLRRLCTHDRNGLYYPFIQKNNKSLHRRIKGLAYL